MTDETRAVIDLSAELASTKAVDKHTKSCPFAARVTELEVTVNGDKRTRVTGLVEQVETIITGMGLMKWLATTTVAAIIVVLAERFIH